MLKDSSTGDALVKITEREHEERARRSNLFAPARQSVDSATAMRQPDHIAGVIIQRADYAQGRLPRSVLSRRHTTNLPNQ